jgi:outer membrane protein OmpA-like peptidoglycan-associated protein
MPKVIVTSAAIAGMLILLGGCATKDWVRTHIEQRVGPVSGGLAEQRQRVAGLEGRVGEESERVGTLEARTAETAESVRETRTRADTAHRRADEVDSRLTRLWSSRHKRDLVESLEVYFGFDRADLDDAAETALASLAQELRGNPRLGVELQGYADPTGPAPYNVALSQRRVEAVRRFLVDKGIELPRIHWIGLGPLVDGGLENAKKRRVTVRTMVDVN